MPIYTIDVAEQHHSAISLASISIMEFFAKLMSVIGASRSGIDFVASLPVEIAELILLKLDPRSVLNVARVSRKWMAVCKGSFRLRGVARRHLRKEERRMSDGLIKQMRTTKDQTDSGSYRKQVALVERAPRQGATISLTISVFRKIEVKRPATLKNRSDKKPSSRANPSTIPTRSSLRLR